MKTIYKKLLFLMLLTSFSGFAQSTLEGTVVDKKSKQPLPGVNVVIQGEKNGTQTDFDGKFKLVKVRKGQRIVFSYVGYQNTSVSYDGQKDLAVTLEEESNQLQEVVIQVGYGSAKKKDATGSVALITAKDFNKGAIVSADQLLTGRAAGVRITNDGGRPDSTPNIRIRGGASLSASNNPLIVIDGVPIGDNNPNGVSNPFTLINPNDIESFSILKDASATAIYGVRASNGVILITTKKGTTGAPQFNFSTSVSIGKVDRKLDIMDGPTFARFTQQYHPDYVRLLGVQDPAYPSDATKRILYNTDWQDQIFRTAISTDHSFSARANLYGKIPFRASIGYSNIQGVEKRNDYQRLSYSFKMTPKLLNDDLKVDINVKGTYSQKYADDGGALGGAIGMDPTKPVYDNSPNNIFGGYYQETKLNGFQNQLVGGYNPVALLNQKTTSDRVTRLLGNIEFDYKLPFLKDLRAIVNLGLDASESRTRSVFDNNSLGTYRFNNIDPAIKNDPTKNYVFNPGLSYLKNETTVNQTMDAYLAYSKSYSGVIRKFDATGGYSYQNFVSDSNEYKYNKENADTGIWSPDVDPQKPNNRDYRPLNLQAYFARTNLDFLGKYLFTATFRADASSLFQKNKRWGYFPAVGLAWKIKEESFLKSANFVQDLKVRVGWGKTGQSNITGAVGYFPSRPFFAPGNQNGQYLSGYTTYTALPYIDDITWEKTTTVNLGLDFEFFKNGFLAGSVDVYQRKTNDLLAKVQAAPGQSSGGTEFVRNIGSIESKGAELNLNIKVIQSTLFNLSIGGNIAYNKNEVTSLNGIQVVQETQTTLSQTGVYLAANPLGGQPYSAYVFEQVYDSHGQPIVGAYVDRNGDGVINEKDKYYKPLQPNWTFGFNTNINYRNFDLSASFRGQIGGQVYNKNKLNNGFTDHGLNTDGNSLNNVLNFYSGAANPLFSNFNGNATYSDYMLEDATFLRCDNISLGYKFAKLIKNSSLRVSASVTNAFILTKYTGQDPENFSGIDASFYPRPKTYTLGLSYDF